MEINKFLEMLDQLYEEKRINDVEPFFQASIKRARDEEDLSAQFTILNEMMGFYRDMSKYEKSIESCRQCLELMEKMGIEGSVDYATALQNIANAHRAAGKLKKSLEFYQQAQEIYEKNIAPDDFRMASINNNIALLYQEMNDYANAAAHLKMALFIIEKIEETEIEQAVTHSNLGASLIELNQTEEALEHLNIALEIFRKDEKKDFHYSAALSAMAAAKCRMGDYVAAAKLYEEALDEIRINMGKGTAYEITKKNLEKVYHKLGVRAELNSEEMLSGIEMSRKFYEDYGRKMIHEKFPKYENKIAVGLVGEGSERFGFDDEYSRDHDFGKGFCMWVTEETYDEIGTQLEREYQKLMQTVGENAYQTGMAEDRTGVMIIGDFYQKYTGYRMPPDSINEWIEIEDYKLATVTNGEIFIDNEGEFTNIRNRFLRLPEKARRVKIAREVAAMAQTGQYNYGRAMARKDYVTAEICISEFMQQTMRCVYLLNKKYAPYYKWMLKGMQNLEILSDVKDMLQILADTPDQKEAWCNYIYDNRSFNKHDKKAVIIEKTAGLIIRELKRQQLTGKNESPDKNIVETEENFLNEYAFAIMQNIGQSVQKNHNQNAEIKEQPMNRDELIEKIVRMEFEEFDKVQNRGGRAECQNNFPTFHVMRTSQYMTWTDEMLQCLYDLWQYDIANGINMITEKYARMMEATAPYEYKEFEDQLPKKSEQTKQIVEQIAQIQVAWMEDFAKEYPKLAQNARDITHDSDAIDNTSYETYLKGELLTYSEEMLKLYAQFIVTLARENKNLAQMTIENTVHLLGYSSLEQAEKES